eukprot:scaffold109990_cov22-Tisochrysis_lutea.AAC.1
MTSKSSSATRTCWSSDPGLIDRVTSILRSSQTGDGQCPASVDGMMWCSCLQCSQVLHCGEPPR